MHWKQEENDIAKKKSRRKGDYRRNIECEYSVR